MLYNLQQKPSGHHQGRLVVKLTINQMKSCLQDLRQWKVHFHYFNIYLANCKSDKHTQFLQKFVHKYDNWQRFKYFPNSFLCFPTSGTTIDELHLHLWSKEEGISEKKEEFRTNRTGLHRVSHEHYQEHRFSEKTDKAELVWGSFLVLPCPLFRLFNPAAHYLYEVSPATFIVTYQGYFLSTPLTSWFVWQMFTNGTLNSQE